MIRYRILPVLVALALAACATKTSTPPPAPKPPSVEISGQWVGTWTGYGAKDVDRIDSAEAEFVQTGATGHGRLYLLNTLTTEAPDIVRFSGANGVPIVFLVSGSDVNVSHERGDDSLTALLTVAGDQMRGYVGEPPAQLRVTFTKAPKKTESEKAAEQPKDKRMTEMASSLAEVRALAENANSKAEEAASMIKETSAAAAQADEKADRALAKAEATDERLNQVWANRLKRTPLSTVAVNFAFNRSDLNAASQQALMDLVNKLKETPNLVVDLRGYTDNVGSDSYNLQLSQRREETIRRFLVENGIDLHRIEFIGFGEAHPAADNKTNEGRMQNRRVVIGVFTHGE